MSGETHESKASLSGAHWVSKYRGSAFTRDLLPPFRQRAEAFIAALQDAGAKVVISSTFRDPRRAYLMHWCWKIVRRNIDPATVPAMEGVVIKWAHDGSDGKHSREASVNAARAMLSAFGMQMLGVAPALGSRHMKGYAIDMNIRWHGTLSIKDANGKMVEITSTPRNGTNYDLRKVGETYRVIKYNRLGRDGPHWSDIGA